VYAGGGTAIMLTNAGLLHEFLAASEIFRVAEAVLQVFARFGDYQHKQRNRMKFMIKTLGWARWREEYDRALAACRLSGSVPTLEIDPPAAEPQSDAPRSAAPDVGRLAASVGASRVKGPGITPIVVPLLEVTDSAYAKWRTTNVLPQKQAGFVMVVATIPLGDLTSEQMRAVGQLAGAYGDGTVRVTIDQDLVFRWVRDSDVPELYRGLAAAGLSQAEAGTIADVASCPGAESCRLAVTQSRGLGRLLEDHLRSNPELIDAADGARIKISGCPNGCGQHHIATFGFQGSVRRLDSQPVPQYFVMVGGGADAQGATFGRLAAKIPARRIPKAVERLIALYTRERAPGESAPSYFARVDLETVKRTLGDLERLATDQAEPADFVDLGEVSAFNPLVMDGECSA
jgi:sulfite reductase (NADPH) hemoprotein beta-component